MDQSEMKAITEKHSARVPKPLNSQFDKRVNKVEALKRYGGRKQIKATSLYPAG